MSNNNNNDGEDGDYDLCIITLERFSPDLTSPFCPVVGECGHTITRQGIEYWFDKGKGEDGHQQRLCLPCPLRCSKKWTSKKGKRKEEQIRSFRRNQLVTNLALCEATTTIRQINSKPKINADGIEHHVDLRFQECPCCGEAFTVVESLSSSSKCCFRIRAPIVGICGHTICASCVYDEHHIAMQYSYCDVLKNVTCPICDKTKAFHIDHLVENTSLVAALRHWNKLDNTSVTGNSRNNNSTLLQNRTSMLAAGKRHRLTCSRIVLHAVRSAAKDLEIQSISMKEGISRSDILSWIQKSSKYGSCVEQIMPSKVEPRSFQAILTKSLLKAGYTRTGTYRRNVKWLPPGDIRIISTKDGLQNEDQAKGNEVGDEDYGGVKIEEAEDKTDYNGINDSDSFVSNAAPSDDNSIFVNGSASQKRVAPPLFNARKKRALCQDPMVPSTKKSKPQPPRDQTPTVVSASLTTSKKKSPRSQGSSFLSVFLLCSQQQVTSRDKCREADSQPTPLPTPPIEEFSAKDIGQVSSSSQMEVPSKERGTTKEPWHAKFPSTFLRTDKPHRKEMDAVLVMCQRNQWRSELDRIRKNSWFAVNKMILDKQNRTTIIHQAIISKGNIRSRARVIRAILQVAPEAASFKDSCGSSPRDLFDHDYIKMDARRKKLIREDLDRASKEIKKTAKFKFKSVSETIKHRCRRSTLSLSTTSDNPTPRHRRTS